MKYRPFCSVWPECCCEIFVECEKVFQFRGVRPPTTGISARRIVKAFDIIMHLRSFGCGLSARVGPHFFYLVGCFSVIFRVGDRVVPFFGVSHHCRDYLLGVEMFKVLMNPCCNRCEFAADVLNRVGMRAFIKVNTCVSRMWVLGCEVARVVVWFRRHRGSCDCLRDSRVMCVL